MSSRPAPLATAVLGLGIGLTVLTAPAALAEPSVPEATFPTVPSVWQCHYDPARHLSVEAVPYPEMELTIGNWALTPTNDLYIIAATTDRPADKPSLDRCRQLYSQVRSEQDQEPPTSTPAKSTNGWLCVYDTRSRLSIKSGDYSISDPIIGAWWWDKADNTVIIASLTDQASAKPSAARCATLLKDVRIEQNQAPPWDTTKPATPRKTTKPARTTKPAHPTKQAPTPPKRGVPAKTGAEDELPILPLAAGGLLAAAAGVAALRRR